jgi:hypothetical protein
MREPRTVVTVSSLGMIMRVTIDGHDITNQLLSDGTTLDMAHRDFPVLSARLLVDKVITADAGDTATLAKIRAVMDHPGYAFSDQAQLIAEILQGADDAHA